MKRAVEQNAADVVGRIKLLPRRHRIAHLRALLRQPLACSVRHEQLAVLLSAETTAQAANENHRT
jgi:hypothetical protein